MFGEEESVDTLCCAVGCTASCDEPTPSSDSGCDAAFGLKYAIAADGVNALVSIARYIVSGYVK